MSDWMVSYCAVKRALDRAKDALDKGDWEQVAISCSEAKAVSDAERLAKRRHGPELEVKG